MTTCAWKEQFKDGAWKRECEPNALFEFNDDGPKGNGFMFCPFCGRTMVEVRMEVEGE